MPRGPAPSGRGPGGNLARGAHAPGAVQPDPTWGWDVAGNPIDEADGWRPVPPGVDPLADPARWAACQQQEVPRTFITRPFSLVSVLFADAGILQRT
jgi:hypothetical protein